MIFSLIIHHSSLIIHLSIRKIMCEVFDVLMADTCDSNMGGTKLKMHYALHNDVDEFGAPAAFQTGDPESKKFKIAEAHTMKTGKSFKTIEITRNTGVNNIGPGGANSGTKVMNPVFRLPSNNDAALALFNRANGITSFVFLIEDANMPDGTYDQIGTDKHYAVITAQKVNGGNNEEGSMYEFTIECTQPYRMLYTAAVPLTPAA